MKVSDILAAKSPATYTIRPTDTVAALSALLRDKRIGAAVVSADGHSIDGVASERDIAYRLSVHSQNFADLPVSAIMTAAVVTCSPADQVAIVASTMISRNIRHVPVVDESRRLIGMVSLRDVLRVRVDELQREAALLRSFANEVSREPQDRD
jgi:CBS domain-containing protein